MAAQPARSPGSHPGRLFLQARYRRSDPRGRFPFRFGIPDLAGNRLAAFWRPVIDITDSQLASLRLRMIPPVASWLADPDGARRSWFSMIGVPGLRRQVVRHAGLPRYDCEQPAGLPPALRTPAWNTLLDAVACFGALDDAGRSLVVFHLAQLSYCQFALDLAGCVTLDGSPAREHYAYEVARIQLRTRGQTPAALATFARLAQTATDPLTALGSCFQGIGHAIRGGDLRLARRFEERGRRLGPAVATCEGWHACLVLSRFHRALGLLRLAEGRLGDSRCELETGQRLHDLLPTRGDDEADYMVVMENRAYLLNLELDLAVQEPDGDVMAPSIALMRLDRYCVETRLRLGDACTAAGDYTGAACWYALAGELGTGSGAIGWYRAAQCYDFIGDLDRAVHAMGRCLELDETAVEPREYLLRTRTGAGPGLVS